MDNKTVGGIVAVAMLALLVGVVWWWQSQEPELPESVVVQEQPLALPEPAAEPPPDAPPPPAAPEYTIIPPPARIDGSDTVFRQSVEQLAAKLALWLVPEEQVRKWVALVDNLADGKLVYKNRPLAYNLAEFKVDTQGAGETEQITMSADNYNRAAPVIDALLAIPPAQLADWYRAWLPLLDQAYAELGRDGSFDQRLQKVIQRVLSASILTAPPQLKLQSVMYTYADEDMEAADDVNKLLWRLGPDNTRRIQDYVLVLQPLL